MSARAARSKRTTRKAHAIQAVILEPRGSRNGSATTSDAERRTRRRRGSARRRRRAAPRRAARTIWWNGQEVPGRPRADGRREARIGGGAERAVDEGGERHQRRRRRPSRRRPAGRGSRGRAGWSRLARPPRARSAGLRESKKRCARDEQRERRRQRGDVEAEGVLRACSAPTSSPPRMKRESQSPTSGTLRASSLPTRACA